MDPGRNSHRNTALVLSETEHFFQLGSTFLEREDVEIMTARGHEEALQRFKTERPDIVILDAELECQESDTLCQALKSDDWLRAIPVLILLKPNADSDEVTRWMEMGCADYVKKPLQDNHVLDKAATLLDLPVRRYLRAAVELEVRGEQKNYVFTGKTLDISVGGLLLETNSPMKIGETLTMRFFLPISESEIEIQARVQREVTSEDRYQYGLSFIDLPEQAKSVLADFVETAH